MKSIRLHIDLILTKHKALFILLFGLCFNSVFSQSPEGIDYQTMIRDSSGIALTSQSISLKISITLPPSSSSVQYSEIHNVSTNDHGLINIIIGQGTYSGGSQSSFSNLDWSQNQYWMKLEMDPNAGTSYTLMSNEKIMSVPYVLYAKTSGNSDIIGKMGETGSKGHTGPIGTLGLQGITGDSGLNGATGAQGIRGALGNNGTEGIQGQAGPDGNQGYLGTNGSMGPSGPVAIGEQGLIGWSGNPGAEGITGDTGNMGNTGDIGIQGATGAEGNVGPMGIIGSNGSSGSQGSAGIIGPTGEKGNLGTTGSQGIIGPQSYDDQELYIVNDSLRIENGNTLALSQLNDHDWHKAQSDNIATSISNNIYTEGNVGIGTDNPIGLLEIYKALYGSFTSFIKANADLDHWMGGIATAKLIDLSINADDADYGTNTAYAIKSNITSNGGNGQFYGIYSSVTSGDNENAIAGYFQASNSGNGNSYAAQFDGKIKAENLSETTGGESTLLYLGSNKNISYGSFSSSICAIDYFEGFDSSGIIPSDWVSSDGGSMARITSSNSCGVSTEAIYLPKDLNFTSPSFDINQCNNMSISYLFREGWNTTGGCMGGSYGGIESSDKLYIEYSLDSGLTWVIIKEHSGTDNNVGDVNNNYFVQVTEILSIPNGSSDIIFRLRAANDGWSDVWLIDNFSLVSSFSYQNLTLNGNILGLSDDNTPVDLNKYQQDLSLAGNTLTLSNDPSTVDLSPYKQSLSANLDILSISGMNSVDLNIKHWERDTGNEYTYPENINDNIGVGTSSPGSLLEVNGGTLKLTNQADSAVLLDLNSERNWHFRQTGSGAGSAMELASIDGGGNKNFLINTSGRVGIGNSSPNDKLDVTGDTITTRIRISSTTGNAVFRAKTNKAEFAWYSKGDVNHFRLWDYNQSIDQASIDSEGNLAIGSTSAHSDAILDIDGQVSIKGGDPADEKALVSDDNGLAKWQNTLDTMDFSGNEVLNTVIHDEENVWAKVELGGDWGGKNIQGFVYDNKNNFLYSSHEAGWPKFPCNDPVENTRITKSSLDGLTPTIVSYSQKIHVGHSQDLSIEYDENGKMFLWTSNESGRGASRIDFNGTSTNFTDFDSIIPLNNTINNSGYEDGASTPTVSTDSRYLVIRTRTKGTTAQVNRIFVHRLADILNFNYQQGGYKPLYEWDVHPDQHNKGWGPMQGILCDNDIIYCISGLVETNVNKLLCAYTLGGKLLYKKEITTGKIWANDQNPVNLNVTISGIDYESEAWEPEGLAIYSPNQNIKTLLVGIVTRDNDILEDVFDGIGLLQFPLCSGNSLNLDVDTRRIYAMGLGKGIWSLDAGKIPNGMGLHFKGPDNRITYEHDEAIQFGQTDKTSNNANSKEYDENMRLNSNGNLGIGLSPNNARLQVSGSGQISGNITASNISGTSDIRYKENISTIANASDRLLKLSGVSFEWKKGHKNPNPHYGVIAQEAEKVFPELVDQTGKTKETKHVEYNGFAGILIEAIKEKQKVLNVLENELEKEQAVIDQIKADNKELKNQNVLLEKKLDKLLKRINKFNNTHSKSIEYTALEKSLHQ